MHLSPNLIMLTFTKTSVGQVLMQVMEAHDEMGKLQRSLWFSTHLDMLIGCNIVCNKPICVALMEFSP